MKKIEPTCEKFDKICEILSHYTPEDHQLFHQTVDELCSKGIAKGCFQDYTVLADILTILTQCEMLIKNGTAI